MNIRYNNKGGIPTLKTIFLLLISAFIFISLVIILFQAKDFTIDDRKINTQIVIERTLSNCFSDEFAVINKDKFTQKNIDECFKGIDESILARLILDDNAFYIQSNREEEFNRRAGLCVKGSSIMCTEMKYPITVREGEEQELKLLKIQLIVT